MKLKLLSVAVSAIMLSACGSSSTEADKNTSPIFSQAEFTLSLQEDNSASITVSASDADAQTLTYSIANAPANGIAELDPSTGKIDYTPNDNFFGEDSLEVAVTDGTETVKTVLKINVESVNDAPVIEIDKVLISGAEVKKGLVSATDIEQDLLTYSITHSPENGELEINSQTGEITYTPQSLTVAEDKFELTVTDSNGASVSKEIAIATGLTTNADRAYYYYASSHSHLKRAESMLPQVKDDVNLGLLNANLASGYAAAGLTKEVGRFLTESAIVKEEQLAYALLSVSNHYNNQGLYTEANAFRLRANNLYTKHIADKGLANFSSNDQMFFDALAISYRQAGEFELANQSFNILDILFKTILDSDATTQALRLVFAFRDSVDSEIEYWQSSRIESDKLRAVEMNDRLYGYSKLIAAREVRNDRNGNLGKFYHSVRQVALGFVIDNYIKLGELEAAKLALLDGLALHGVAGIDENYPIVADEHADVTHAEYPFGLVNMATRFVVLYPELSVEDILAVKYDETSFFRSMLIDDAEEARLMASVRNATNKDDVLQKVLNTRDDENLRPLFTDLLAFNASNPGAAAILIEQGEYEAAGKFVIEALNVLKDEKYITQNIDVTTFVTGATGCNLVLNTFMALNRLTAEQKYNTYAIDALATCRDIANTHYSTPQGTDVLIEDVAQAHLDLIKHHGLLGQESQAESVIAKVKASIQAYDEKELSEKTKDTMQLAVSLARGGMHIKANQYLAEAIALIKQLENNIDAEYQFISTNEFFDESSYRDLNFVALQSAIKQSAGQNNNFAAELNKANALWAELVTWNIARLDVNGSVQQKATFYTVFSDQLIKLGQFEQALALKDKSGLGEVEIDSIINQVANALSVLNQFVTTNIATVDTDGDGKANFFAPFATEQMITDSGIELDLDSDNDGVNDDQDAYPLDASKK